MSKSTLTLLAVGMLGVGGFASMDTEALAQTLSEESNSRSVSQFHSRDTRMRHTRTDESVTGEKVLPPQQLQKVQKRMYGKGMQYHRGFHRNKSRN